MEKELFRILQEIKIGINIINSNDFEKKINKISNLEAKTIIMNNLYIDAYRKNKAKFILFSIFTFGIYYYKNKYDYELRNEILEGAIDNCEDNYYNLVHDRVLYRAYQMEFDMRLNFFNKNFNQIDSFLELVQNLSEEEKQKYLSYKIN